MTVYNIANEMKITKQQISQHFGSSCNIWSARGCGLLCLAFHCKLMQLNEVNCIIAYIYIFHML